MPLSEKAKKHKSEYIIDYAKKHYKRIPLDVTAAQYDKIKSAAERANESVNGYIKKSISQRIEHDNSLSDNTVDNDSQHKKK